MAKKRKREPMTVEFTVTEKRKIPANRLLELAAKVRERFGMDDGAAVHVEDLLIQAEMEGICELPEKWTIIEDGEYTDADLKEYFTG